MKWWAIGTSAAIFLVGASALLPWYRNIDGPAYVIDGDTISVKGYHIRLAGIDAEEMNEPHGPRAKAALNYILGAVDMQVRCKLNGEKSYQRYVGTCYIGEGDYDIGMIMVAGGFALDCAHYSHQKYRLWEPQDAREKLIQKPYC